jgi:tartrate dehydrogenase/decarboxylase/D-malate dehydrogenase
MHSWPAIYGKMIANPTAQTWSGAMTLEHLGHTDAADAIVGAIEGALVDEPQRPAARHGPRTRAR